MGALNDSIERKQTEGELRASEVRYRRLFESAKDGILILDADTEQIVDVNPFLIDLLGSCREDLAGKKLWEIGAFQDIVASKAMFQDLQARGYVRYEHLPLETKDGRRVDVEFVSNVYLAEQERVIQCNVRDITERKRAEQTQRMNEAVMREQLAELELIYRNAPVGLALLDTGLRFVRVNEEFAAFNGIPAADHLGRHLGEIVPDIFPKLEPLYLHVLETGEPIRNREFPGSARTKPGGTGGWFLVSYYPLKGEDGGVRGVGVVVVDISERRKGEEALRASEARYRELVENASYGIYVSTVEGAFLDVNPALMRMLGYDSKEELLGLRLATNLYVNPDDRARMIEEFRRTGQLFQDEVGWKRKDGTPILVQLGGRGLRDVHGQLKGFEVIVEDVTERKALEQQLRQALKMEAVGQLSGGIAHDFNNLLGVIIGYSELLADRFASGDPTHHQIEEIHKAGKRAALLTHQLLAFSRQQIMQLEVLDLNNIVAGVEEMLRRVIREDIALVTILAPGLGGVKADVGQIEQVLMNLVVNSRDAMPQGGKLTIETANVELDEDYARLHSPAAPGPHVMLAVSDTGTGMDNETLAHIFEPFFTTKELGKGTGLGLATVYGIVRQSGGHVCVYSEVGSGTTFKIYLPQVEATGESGKTKEAPTQAQRGSETILLVEDTASLRELTREILEKSGYTVLEAGDPLEAIEIAKQHQGRISLLLTDVVMPGIGGHALAERLTSMQPAMKVLYISGYPDETIVHHGVVQRGVAFLQKPYTRDALARKVREVLNRPKG